eukprot:1066919-Karenia_brevis.AAC.1
MLIASTLFIAKTTAPRTPPADVPKRPWPWNTPDRVGKAKKNAGGTDLEYVCAADLFAVAQTLNAAASLTG